MANYKVAYGKRENMSLAIERGIIPPGSIILTEDTNELFFYDLSSNLKTYEERYKFDSLDEAQEWVDKYNCAGQILSVHHDGKCHVYVVNYNNMLEPITSAGYVAVSRDPTSEDYEYELCTHWINTSTNKIFILINSSDNNAIWQQLITEIPAGKSDSNYVHTQNQASALWVVSHGLDKYPAVTIVDSSGDVVIGDITYTDLNNLTVKFSSAFSGKAYIN